MSLVMPKPDEATLLKSSSIINGLKKISKHVLSEEEEKAVYETDGLSIHRQKPIAVVLPENTKEVSQILKYCFDNNVKVYLLITYCLFLKGYLAPNPKK